MQLIVVSGLPGAGKSEVADVERVKSYYAPWDEARLVLDALDPLANNIAAALSYLLS